MSWHPLVLLSWAACPVATDTDTDIDTGTSLDAPSGVDTDGDGVADADDCDPSDPNTFPGAEERCDGRDNDCDGSAVEPTQRATVVGGDNHDTITSAIQSADDGAEIWVCPGSYTEPLTVQRDLVLVGLERPTVDAGQAGAVVDVASGSLTLRGFVLTGGTGSPHGPLLTNGGGINGFRATGPLLVEDCHIEDNVAELGGGVLFGPEGGRLEGTTVALNVAGSHGAGVHAEGPTALVNSVLSGNVAASFGGGLSVAEAVQVTASQTEVSTNLAQTGGGVFLFEGAMMSADPSTEIRANRATLGAGAFLSSATWEGGVVADNEATEIGGGLDLNGGGTARRVHVTGNVAESGAGITADGVVTFEDVDVDGNTASEAGGGVYALDATITADADTVVHDNTASDVAGGLFLLDSVWSGGTIAHNEADNGGGVYFSSFAASGSSLSDAVVHDNTAVLSGGGAYMSGPWQLTDCLLDQNTSLDRGGAVYSTGSVGTARNTAFVHNGAVQRGGGLYLNTESVATLTTSTIEGNQTLRGSGVYLNGDSTLSLVNSTLADNGNATSISGGGARVTRGALISTCTQWGSGDSDNAPDDVFVEGLGAIVGYGTCAHFSCTHDGGCTPEP
ncbi:MAG: putative metal-binding motif-containing protein [Myxococcales bacterium]|nr:putative metal-binding motif-containing protein [Myxococcales bacterium]